MDPWRPRRGHAARGVVSRSRVLLAALALAAGCSQEARVPVLPCPDLRAGCTLGGGARVQTDVAPAPLAPFVVTVQAPHAREVAIGFEMEGMEMGPNRYRLVREPEGLWRARVLLPVCVSGRRDWLMVVEIDGVRERLPFTTP